jgi:phage shock protein E
VSLKTAGDLITEAQKTVSCVDVESARKIYQESSNVMILDVRESDSAAKSKLSDSTNISRGLLEMKLPNLCSDPDTVILVHCGGGGRASLAALTLKSMGYNNVHAITAPYDDIKSAFG